MALIDGIALISSLSQKLLARGNLRELKCTLSLSALKTSLCGIWQSVCVPDVTNIRLVLFRNHCHILNVYMLGHDFEKLLIGKWPLKEKQQHVCQQDGGQHNVEK